MSSFSDPRYRLGLHDFEPDVSRSVATSISCGSSLKAKAKVAGSSSTDRSRLLMPRSCALALGEELTTRRGSFGLPHQLQLVLAPARPDKQSAREALRPGSSPAHLRDLLPESAHPDMDGGVRRVTPYSIRISVAPIASFIIRHRVANPMWNQPTTRCVRAGRATSDSSRTAGSLVDRPIWLGLQPPCYTQGNGRAAIVLVATRHAREWQQERGQGAQHPALVQSNLIDGVICSRQSL